ncbi:hypothetical protein J2S78_000152 [Salibacterium salarium]|nr:hypothetical protein [Salibacterium salarium]
MVIIIVFIFIGYSKYSEYQNRLEASIGNNLHNLLVRYDDIASLEDISEDNLNDIKSKMESISVISKNLDVAYGTPVLINTSEHFNELIEAVDSNYTNNPEISKSYYQQLIKKIDEMENIVYDNYYANKHSESGIPNLNVNVEELNNFNEELDEYLETENISN